MIFQKEFEYTDDAYDAALEINEKKIYRRINIVTLAVMAVFLIILIIVSLVSRIYGLLIAGLVFIIIGGASYVFRSSDLHTFIDSYSPEKWEREYTRRYMLTLYDDRVNIDIFRKEVNPAGAWNDGFARGGEESVYIGDDPDAPQEDFPGRRFGESREENMPSLFSFEYDPFACRCYESDEAFLIFRKTYDCMPFCKDQMTDDEIWTMRSYFSERMGKKFVRIG